uniref:Uncharacterized protein n=1 Tax=Ascaris lumbricoides TaxID=6252 RepID=A0A0M3IV74_ASCLU
MLCLPFGGSYKREHNASYLLCAYRVNRRCDCARQRGSVCDIGFNKEGNNERDQACLQKSSQRMVSFLYSFKII